MYHAFGGLVLSVLSLASLLSPITIHNDGVTVTWSKNVYDSGYVYRIIVEPREVTVESPQETSVEEKAPTIEEQIQARFGIYWEKAWRIADCETGHTFDPYAVGRAGERGLFQIHPIHVAWIQSLGYSWDDMFIPAINIQVAWLMSRGGTYWVPWSCNYA